MVVTFCKLAFFFSPQILKNITKTFCQQQRKHEILFTGIQGIEQWHSMLFRVINVESQGLVIFFQLKIDPVELEEVSPVTSMVLSQEIYRGQSTQPSSVVTTSVASTPLAMSWMTSEPVQWSRLRMTYSFEYFIMKQYGKVLLQKKCFESIHDRWWLKVSLLVICHS